MEQSVMSETKTKWYTSLSSTFGSQILIKLTLARILKKTLKDHEGSTNLMYRSGKSSHIPSK